jgi:hypothetical protein
MIRAVAGDAAAAIGNERPRPSILVGAFRLRKGASMASKPVAVHRHLRRVSDNKESQVPGTAQLTYYIFEGVLVGYIGTEMVHIIAWSGGAGGSTRKDAPQPQVVNNPYLYGLKSVSQTRHRRHVHGGPIPTGRYQIYPPAEHKKLGLSSFLRPLQRLPNDRDGFFIHKQGPHGSDGCIVPAEESFTELMNKLKASGGGSLHVCQSMDGAFA